MSDQPVLSGLAAVVLGAGLGTRMKSDVPKVMHPVAGRPMVKHVLGAVGELGPERTIVVIGPDMDQLAAAVAPAQTAVQDRPLGTAHAVQAARRALEGFPNGTGQADVLILFGDAVMIEAQTIRDLVAARRDAGAAVAVLGVHVESRNRYGRFDVSADGDLEAIIEYRDASEALRTSTLCNSGMMTVDAHLLFDLVDRIGNDNDKGEFYLTDIVAVARAAGHRCAVLETVDPEDLIGADDRQDLARFEGAMQKRLRDKAMSSGVHLVAPETVFFSYDTQLEPRCEGRTSCCLWACRKRVGTKVLSSRASSHLEGCQIVGVRRAGWSLCATAGRAPTSATGSHISETSSR